MSQVGEARGVLGVPRGHAEQVVRQGVVRGVFPFKVMESDPRGDRGEDRDVHLDREPRGQLHLDEVPQFLEMLKLGGNYLKME